MAGEKRSAEASEEVLHQESAILLDIEGTTSSISFVKDTLFPYVREFLKKHVDEKWETEEFKADLAKLKEQAKEDEEKKVEGFVAIKEEPEDEAKETLIKNVLWQMDNDRKTGALKQLQGHMWKAAHKPIKGHVYDDVPKAFEEWTSNGKKLYIYSSGSVEAQKLLFGDSVHGDLLKYISGHFDTEVGAKQEADSYKNILKKINLEASDVLFLTDVVKEAEAAKAAGLSTTIVIREGNAKLSDEDKTAFKTIESFAELAFQSTTKRQKLEIAEETEKKDAPKEVNENASAEPISEPMDTSEDVKSTNEEKKTETSTDVKVEESKVEKSVEEKRVEAAEKEAEKVDSKNEKEDVPMEENSRADETSAVTKTEAQSSEKTETVAEEKSKTEKVEIKVTEVEEKTEKKQSETEKTTEPEATKEEPKEKEAENVAAEVTKEKVDEKPEEKVKEEIKTEEKKVEENGKAEVAEVEKDIVTAEKNTEVVEKKEAVKKVEEADKTEAAIEVAVEVKETEKEEKKVENGTKTETEAKTEEETKLNGTTTNGDVADEKSHSNGVSKEVEKSTENEDTTEESIKVKKAVADGAGESDVVAPPAVAATS